MNRGCLMAYMVFFGGGAVGGLLLTIYMLVLSPFDPHFARWWVPLGPVALLCWRFHATYRVYREQQLMRECMEEPPPGWAGRTLAELSASLGSDDWIERGHAIEALAKRGEEAAPAVPALTQCLSDRYLSNRECAITALGRIGKPAECAIPALEKLLGDEHPEVRDRANLALGRIRRAVGRR